MSIPLQIIKDQPNSGSINMATDLYMLSRCEKKPCIYLRFYSWSVPCITIGYMQNSKILLDFKKMKSAGISWVKRPTGGRAVLHHNDVTYSCVFSENIKEMGVSISETYKLISECLVRGFANNLVNADFQDSGLYFDQTKRDIKLPCFLAPNRDEIMVNGKKLIGSAQKRTSIAVLQHGSIPLTGDFRALPEFQNMDEKDRKAHKRLMFQKCTCIEECLDNYEQELFIENLLEGFKERLPFSIIEKTWTTDEKNAILELSESEEFRKSWMI